MLFCCLWRNVETSCHKHFIVVSRHQQTPPRITNLPHCSGTVLISPDGRSVDSTRRSQILAQNRDFCLPHRHSTTPLGVFPSEYCHVVWYDKTRMVWLPDGEKFVKIWLFVLTECTNVTDTQTRTAWRHRPRLDSIAWQKRVQTL